MSEHTMVSEHIDNCTICASAAQEGPLSRAHVLLYGRGRLRPAGCCVLRWQVQCQGCSHWMSKAKADGHAHCRACRDSASVAPVAALSPPPQSLFGRPVGCLDQLSLVERAAIVTLHGLGWAGQAIAQELRCSENTVSLWIHRWDETRSLDDAERSGRPRCTDEATDAAIEAAAEETPRTVPKVIKQDLQLDCSARTIRRRLDEVGLLGRVGRTEYAFDERDLQRRLSFAEGYADWSVADWGRVIFSDETHIEVYGRSRVWVQRPSGHAFDPDYMVKRVPHSERVSLWGCFCARGVGQAEIFVGDFDAARYVDILQHNLIQTALHFYPNEHWWFQQDNAPQHTSHLARRWFHNHGVDLLDFPPYSPDLNPIENLWGILKARVESRLARTTDEVERVLKEEWEALDAELLTSLAHSMPTRCAAVVANRGHKAPY
jgi:transposase